jgi:uncharacterized protein (TIGR01777 family)
MKVLISGGTGFVGSILLKRLVEKGHEVTLLGRSIESGRALPKGAELILCETTRPGTWQSAVAEHEAIINLAGASIFRRWTRRGKQEILDSRILSTRNIVEALAGRRNKPTRFLSISGVGYYGFHGDEILEEDSPPGNDFLAQLARQWEDAAEGATKFGASVVLCRSGHVMGRGGGVLSKLAMISRLHLGGKWGNGMQWLSWIHESDLANIFLFLLEHKEIEGPVNVTAPNPVRNREMMKMLQQTLKARSVVPVVPAFLLKMVTGEFAGVFLNGQRVLPRRLLEQGYAFEYGELRKAMQDLLG